MWVVGSPPVSDEVASDLSFVLQIWSSPLGRRAWAGLSSREVLVGGYVLRHWLWSMAVAF